MHIVHIILFATRITNPFEWGNGIFTFLYLGPETIMPLASVLAAVIGALLIFWRFIIGSIKRFFRFIFRRGQNPEIEEDLAATVNTDGEEINN